MPVAVASSLVTVDGAGLAGVAIFGSAPGIVPAPWSIAAGENAATINSHPGVTVSPSWSIEVIEDVVVIYNFPRDLIQSVETINVEVTGSATGRTEIAGRRVAEAFDSANGGTLIPFRS